MIADVVVGHIGDKSVSIAGWIVFLYVLYLAVVFIIGWLSS